MKRTPLNRKPWSDGAYSSLRPQSPNQAARQRRLAETKSELIELRGDWCEAWPLLEDRVMRSPDDFVALAALMICQQRALELHHVIPRSLCGTDSPDNLMLLCSACHALTEIRPGLCREIGLIQSIHVDVLHEMYERPTFYDQDNTEMRSWS